MKPNREEQMSFFVPDEGVSPLLCGNINFDPLGIPKIKITNAGKPKGNEIRKRKKWLLWR